MMENGLLLLPGHHVDTGDFRLLSAYAVGHAGTMIVDGAPHAQ